MKENILPAVRLTFISILFFMGLYSVLIWGVAQAVPNQAKGETVVVNGNIAGYRLVGQKFTEDQYFWSRPSAVDYNAAGSGASNKGPSNPDYLKVVQNRIDTFLMHNPGVQKKDIPADLVTASGSGLDPNISVQGAYVQIPRIAHLRKIASDRVKALVDQHIEKPIFGFLGTEKVNVLQLNIDLDHLVVLQKV